AGDASAAVVREIRSDRGLDEVGRRTGERVGVVGGSSSEPSAVSGDDASFEARVGSELDAEPTSLKGGGAILDHASDQSGSGAELYGDAPAADLAVAVADDHVADRGMGLERDAEPASAEIVSLARVAPSFRSFGSRRRRHQSVHD